MEHCLFLAAANITAILVACIIGAICGFLAGQIMKGRGFGLLGNMVVGVVGAALFGSLFSSLNLFDSLPFMKEIVGGTLGSVILLFIIGLIKKAA